VRLYATNGIACGIALVPEATKSGSGQIVLPAQQFMSIVNGLGTAATFSVSEDDKIKMSSSGWNCKLPFIQTTLQSPKLTNDAKGLTLRIEPLVHAVECAISAIGKGVVMGFDVDSALFDFSDHAKPRIVAADSKQMMIFNLPAISSESQPGAILKVPSAGCKALLSFFANQEGLVKLKYTDNLLCIWNDTGVLYLLLAGGGVFPVAKVMEHSLKGDKVRVVAPKLQLLQAIRRASVAIRNDDGHRLDLILGGLTLTCQGETDATGQSSASVDLDSVSSQTTRSVCLDSQAMENAVNKISSDTIVMLMGNDEPLIFDCDSVWWTIMPFIRETDDAQAE
jgi:DNA polymerase III sliding clamp (beta) subunit (PCNA family)